MRVGIIQSNYIPWRGYFDLIASVDLFIIHDDLQYTKQDWRNRNRIKTPQGPEWVTVPVHYARVDQLIDETFIAYDRDWIAQHLGKLRQSYRQAPFFTTYFGAFAEIVQRRLTKLSDLNLALLRWAMTEMGITTEIRLSRDLQVTGQKTERLIQLLRAVGATDYLSGPAACAYIETSRFAEAGIGLSYKSYDYAPYPQLWGAYDPAVSILDTLFMLGPDAGGILRSSSVDERVLAVRVEA